VLGDRERDALHEVERRFLVDDPEFAGLFDAQVRRLAAGRPHRRGTGVGATFVIALGLLVLMTSSVAMALLATVGAGVLWATWRYADLEAGFEGVASRDRDHDGGR
jgi:hypothetical protein